MSHQRAHVVVPTELLEEIDRVVGQRKRSQFLAAAAERELKRLRQIEAIEHCSGGWHQAKHPELKRRGGSASFVRKLRKESDRRL